MRALLTHLDKLEDSCAILARFLREFVPLTINTRYLTCLGVGLMKIVDCVHYSDRRAVCYQQLTLAAKIIQNKC